MKKISLFNELGVALKVSFIYVIFSSIYFLFSDYIATSIFSDSQFIRTIRVFQGWGFVVASGVIIYLLIKRLQRAADDTEERFLLLADLTIEGIILHKNGVVLDVNDALTELFGYKRTDIIGKNLIDIFISEEYKPVCIENLKSQSLEPYIVRAQKKNGGEIWVQIIGKPFRFFGKKARVAAIRDITIQKIAEEKLRNSESYLRSIIENEPEGIIILGPKGDLKYINPAGLRMIEVDDMELVKGKCVYPMIINEHREAFIEIVNGVFKGEKGTLQFLIMGVKGTKLWLETKAIPLYDSQGNIESLLGISQNITERKKALDALKESEKILSVIVDSTPLILMLLDADHQVVKMNQTGINLSEKSEQQAKGLLLGQLLDCVNAINTLGGCGKGPNCSNCQLRNSLRSTFETHESLHKIEAKLDMGSNENNFERTILVTTQYICVEGKPHVLVCIDDITERVQMEDVLREKTSMLLKAQELGKIGEFHYDIYRKTFKISSSLELLLGFNRSIVPLEEFVNSIHPDDKESLLDILNAPIINNNKLSINFRLFKPNGETQYLFAQAEIQRESKARAAKVFGIVLDVSEQKKAEVELSFKNHELQATEEELTATNDAIRESLSSLEIAKRKAEESDHLKSAFLANMSHEIRTPMNAIMGFAEIMDMEDLPFDKRKMFTQTIRERSKDLLNIINDLLDISRIESQTLKIVETNGNINKVLSEINDFYHIKNKEIYCKPITLNVINELETDQNYIEADFERIKQILVNLLENAFKFTHEGSITLGCKIIDNNKLHFSVSDTGIGISKDKIGLIFERFRQGDESYLSRDYDGVGLGLSICKGIIELMNGEIWVESEPSIGSTFYFTIPYKPILALIPQKELLRNIKYDFSNRTMLIVEDIEYNRILLQEILKNTSVNIMLAENGAMALEMYRTHPEIDVVLMDIRLPDINGLELTKTMKLERKDIKVIAQTAYASNSERQKAIDAGCNDYISKPINRGLLLDMLSKQLNK